MISIKTILFGDDFVKLLQFSIYDLLTHRIANTISVDEDVLWQGTVVVFSVAFEGTHEVVGQDLGANDFLTLLWLRTSLGIVLTKVCVVSGTETNGTLSTFVTDINAYKHSFGGDLLAKVHAPKVTTDFGVHLTDNVEEDAVIVLHNGAVGNKLRDYWAVTVDLVLDYSIEFLVITLIWHNNHENKLERNTAFDRFILGNGLKVFSNNVIIISLNLTCKSCEQLVFILQCLVVDCNNLCELNVDV
mmetsp:Transcript_24537/g.17253  ORF Transcript_24537/g.17253 Transcript_24537/m.17253 type:complete len:245 (-) Transcript_24537:1711-2445(-)